MQMSWNKKPTSSYVPWSGDEEFFFFFLDDARLLLHTLAQRYDGKLDLIRINSHVMLLNNVCCPG